MGGGCDARCSLQPCRPPATHCTHRPSMFPKTKQRPGVAGRPQRDYPHTEQEQHSLPPALSCLTPPRPARAAAAAPPRPRCRRGGWPRGSARQRWPASHHSLGQLCPGSHRGCQTWGGAGGAGGGASGSEDGSVMCVASSDTGSEAPHPSHLHPGHVYNTSNRK